MCSLPWPIWAHLFKHLEACNTTPENNIGTHTHTHMRTLARISRLEWVGGDSSIQCTQFDSEMVTIGVDISSTNLATTQQPCLTLISDC